MLAFVDKYCWLSFIISVRNTEAEALRRYQTEKKRKKGSYPITPARLISLVQRFKETGCLQNRSRSGLPRLSEVHTCSVVSQMSTLWKQSTSGIPVPVYISREVERNTGIPKTLVLRIFQGVLQA